MGKLIIDSVEQENPAQWFPPEINLGEGATSGVSILRALGGGLQWSFDSSSDDEWSVNKLLRNAGVDYDGSDLQIKIRYQLSSNGGGTDNVKLNLQYQLVTIGDDTDGLGTTINETIDVSSEVSGQIYEHTFGTNLTGGVLGDDELMFSIERNSTGAGADSYGGNVWVIGIEILKV